MNNNSSVPVWDILVRLFHWSLVFTFVVAYASGEDESDLHIYTGYAVLSLICFRVIWGIIGTKYARFTNFVYSPFVVVGYIKSLLTKNPKHYLGHNPAGGYMVLALILSLFVVTLSGLKLYAVEQGRGPFASDGSGIVIRSAYANGDDIGDKHKRNGRNEKDEEFWEEIHEAASNFTLLLIFLHISGVIASGRLHKENLVKAMITGRKKSQ